MHVVGKNNPGIGEYDLTGFNAIGRNTMDGGGAPNNFTICYRDMNPTIRKVEVKTSPRLLQTIVNSKLHFSSFLTISFTLAPNNLGPGVYAHDASTDQI